MIAIMKGYALTEETNETVMAVGSLNLEGNITPQSWFEHLRYDNGKPHTIAIVILSDIVYWYRPVEVRDEQTGRLLGYRKKFRGSHLQRSRKSYEDQYGFSKKQVRDAFDFLESKNVITIIVEKRVTTSAGDTLGNVPYIQLHASKLAEINTPLCPTGPRACPTSPSYSPTGPTNTEITTETTEEKDFAANDTRQESPKSNDTRTTSANPRQAKSRNMPEQTPMLMLAEVEPKEKKPRPPREPDALFDAIAEVWQSAPSMTGKIKQQLMGKIPERNADYAANFDEPATPDEVRAFGEWYAKKCVNCSMPLARPAIQNHFYAFRRDRAAAIRKSAPKTRVANGRLMEFNEDSRNWYDIGPAPQNYQEAYAS